MAFRWNFQSYTSGMNSSIDEITRQGGKKPSRKEPTLNPPPKTEKSTIGVTSSYILNKRYSEEEKKDKWYVLRIRYNHDEDAYRELLSAQISKVYFATHQVVKLVHGKRKKIKAPLIPGLLFAFSSRKDLDYFMFGNSPMAEHVRYYRNSSMGKDEYGYNDPVTVPDREMESFMKICDAENPYVQVIPSEKQQQIRKGDWVRVIGGPFKDVVGRTAIVKRQRCVLVELQGICSISTAFITKALLEPLPTKDKCNDEV